MVTVAGKRGAGAPPGSNQGGGPATEAGRQTALANLDPKAAQKHGLRAWQQRGLFPVCRMCVAKDECEAYDAGGTCRIAEDHQNSIIRDVMALAHIADEDRPVVVEYSKVCVGLALCDLYLSVAGGPFLPGADKGFVDVQPATKYRADLTKTLLNYANALGLTPSARARLRTEDKGKYDDLARALAAMSGQQAEQHRAG
ncbi:MAG: P27 family phage terminase small subunit, partial [Armatimonadia bacterium]